MNILSGRIRSFSQHDLDSKPYRADQAGDDHRDDGFEGIALHPAKNDEAVARRLDLVVEQLESAAYAKGRKLALDQAL